MPPPPSLNGAHAARNKRKLGDHRPRAKRNRSLPSPLSQSQRGLFTDGGGRTSEGGGGGGRLYNGTTRNQSISIAVLAVLQGRQEEANAVSPIVVPMRHEGSKRPAGRVARGGRGKRVLLN